MRDLTAIVAAYSDVDGWLEAKRSQASAKGDEVKAAKVADQQRLNDQAYFVLCWGQLESAIDEVCRRALRERQKRSSWSERRGWDLYDPDDRRLSGLSFENRLAFVTDRTQGRGSPWARIIDYYGQRNGIAHGRLRPERIDVRSTVEEFFILQATLNE